MTNLRGYSLFGPQTVTDAMSPLMLAHDIIVQQLNGILVFKYRGDTGVVTIDNEEVLSAHAEGGEVVRPFSMVDSTDLNFPSEVNVNFIEGENDYQEGSVRERNLFAPVENVKRIRLPLVMEELDARKIAFRELWTEWTNRQTVKLALPPSFLDLVENDKLVIPYDGKTIRILIRQIERGRNGVLLVEGVIESEQSRDWSNAVSQGPGTTPYDLPNWVDVDFWLIDLAPLGDGHVQVSGFYIAGCATDFAAHWDGIRLYSSADDVTYGQVEGIEAESVLGKLISPNDTLGDGPFGVWDKTNTIDVELFHGSLSSKTELEVLNGANTAIVGTEIIGFQTATLISGQQYTLSNLLRGLRGTEAAIPNHVAKEGFALLNVGTFKFVEWSLESNKEYYWKGVPVGAQLSDVTAFQAAYKGNNLKCFAPVHIKGERDVSNNLTIKWVRRTRYRHSIFSLYPTPWDESWMRWYIDIYEDDTKVNLLRTVGLTGGIDPFSHYYTATQQAADGITPGDLVYVEIFQVGARVGRGKPGAEMI